MKCVTAICMITVSLLIGGNLQADEVQLTRAQWLKKVGESAIDESVLKETFAMVADSEKVEFLQRTMKAVSRMPVEPEKKAATFVITAVNCIQVAKGDIRYNVISEVFATVPVSFLPVVTEELSKRFNQEFNKLSDAAYEEIAKAVVGIAVKRNERTEDPAVRNTFVVLAFLRGTANAELEGKLLALISDDRTQRLVAGWLPAASNGDYTALLAAADVEALRIMPTEFQRLLGHANVADLLFRMRSDISIVETYSDSWISSSTAFNQPTDFGLNRIPRLPTGYQNQSTSVKCKCPPPPNPWSLSGQTNP